jgi:hypothetical protein
MTVSVLANAKRWLIIVVMAAWVGIASLGAGCGKNGDFLAAAPKPSPPLYSKEDAALVAERLLAAVAMPRKTRRVAQPPPSVATELVRSPNSENSPKSVDRYAFWISTERPRSILAFVAAHAPGKLYTSGYGGTAGKVEEWWEILRVPVASPLAGPREVFVAAVLDGTGRYALRIDAVTAWHRRRPQDSLVPDSARWLRATVTEPAFRALNPGERSHPRTTIHNYYATAARTVLAIATAVNELPVAEPGGAVPSCPATSVANTYGAPRFRLSFRASASGRTLAVVKGRSGYVCERGGAAAAKITTPQLAHGVLLTDHLNGVTVPRGEGLTERIEAAFGHTLHLVPAG